MSPARIPWWIWLVQGRFTPLSSHLPDAPAEWRQFFERALSPKTAERPQSAQEFVSSLGKAFTFVEKSAAG